MLDMDMLPTVISCCFCCFLRAGSVMIGIVSLLTGLFLAPNVSNVRGFWDLGVIMSAQTSTVEYTAQMTIGLAAIWLCCISALLITGSLCNVPKLILIYQWGVVGHCGLTMVIYLILSLHCFLTSVNCLVAGMTLVLLIFFNIIFTAYFVIVVNSLRMSMIYLNKSGIVEA